MAMDFRSRFVISLILMDIVEVVPGSGCTIDYSFMCNIKKHGWINI